ncbi:MAG: hypothetical protein ACOCNL_12855, partial [Acetivibrio ethanolgignens]
NEVKVSKIKCFSLISRHYVVNKLYVTPSFNKNHPSQFEKGEVVFALKLLIDIYLAGFQLSAIIKVTIIFCSC